MVLTIEGENPQSWSRYGPTLSNLKFFDLEKNLITVINLTETSGNDISFDLIFKDLSKYTIQITSSTYYDNRYLLRYIIDSSKGKGWLSANNTNQGTITISIPDECYNKISYIQIKPFGNELDARIRSKILKFYKDSDLIFTYEDNKTYDPSKVIKINLNGADFMANLCDLGIIPYSINRQINIGDIIYDENTNSLYRSVKEFTTSGLLETDLNNGNIETIVTVDVNTDLMKFKGTVNSKSELNSISPIEGDVYFSKLDNCLFLYSEGAWVQVGTSETQDYVVSGDYKIIRTNDLYRVYITKPILQLIKNRKVTTINLLTDEKIKDIQSYNISIKGMPEALQYQAIVTDTFEFKLTITNYSNVDINVNGSAYIEFLTKSDLITEVQP